MRFYLRMRTWSWQPEAWFSGEMNFNSTLMKTGIRSLLLVGAMLFAADVAMAQSGKVEFESTSFDFGIIEEGEEATHTFVFTNVGDAPVSLVDVRPSCGCTTPRWTREPVAPGATGNVTAIYHSEGRPGPFDKGITIHTDGEPEVLQLRIRGDVSPVQLAGERLGNLVVSTETVQFSGLRVGPPGVASFRIQNAGSTPIRVDSVLSDSPVLFADYGGRTLSPGQTDEITLILETDDLAAGQSVSYGFTLVTDDATAPRKVLTAVGTVQ